MDFGIDFFLWTMITDIKGCHEEFQSPYIKKRQKRAYWLKKYWKSIRAIIIDVTGF